MKTVANCQGIKHFMIRVCTVCKNRNNNQGNGSLIMSNEQSQVYCIKIDGKIMCGSRGGDRGSRTPPPPPSPKNHKNIGFLSPRSPGSSLARQGNTINALSAIRIPFPLSKKKLDPLWQNFLDPRMKDLLVYKELSCLLHTAMITKSYTAKRAQVCYYCSNLTSISISLLAASSHRNIGLKLHYR